MKTSVLFRRPFASLRLFRLSASITSLFLFTFSLVADEAIKEGVHPYTPDYYQAPKDPRVQKKVEWFRDQKLALMMHFGIYTQLGIPESWPLVDAEAYWSRLLVDWAEGDAFKRQYLSMIKSFNPVRFMPEVWADIAARNGFKYLILTTKHHDGFCLFDSKHTDFKVTNPECPFSTDRHADIIRSAYDAFRARGLGISCYFSKADWHHPDYWDNCGIGYKTTRFPSYDAKADAARWNRFAKFTHDQIIELVRDYGPLDAIWLDGDVESDSGLDVGIAGIIADARKIQPDLVSIDRGGKDEYEDIITPEQTVPEKPMTVPWETCITMGRGFSYRYDDVYKSSRELIHLLIDVVAKGGNLALNVAPAPDGRIPTEAVKRLDAMGAWLKANGEAIYATRIQPPYRVDAYGGTTCFTRKGDVSYAIRLWRDCQPNVRRFVLPADDPKSVRRIVHVPTGREIPFVLTDRGLALNVPADIPLDPYAEAFRLE